MLTFYRFVMQRVNARFPNSTALRYAVIGGSAFVVDIGLLNLGLFLGWPLLAANGLAVTVAILYSFILHRSFTFVMPAKETGYLMRRRSQFFWFVIISLVAILLNELLMGVMVHRSNVAANPAKVITSLLMYVWNYNANKWVTFRYKN